MASVASNDTLEPAAAAKATINKTGPLRIILLVEATAAAASGWSNIRKWLDVILQKVEIEVNAAADASQPERQQEPNSTMPGIQYSLIVYGTRDRSTQAPVQCSAWTSKRTQLAAWLDGIQFVGGVSSKGTALPQALAEAIVMSKSPYPGGAKPAPAAASHPAPLSLSEDLPVHTHVVVCCPALNPCRLPILWPCAADTKARLMTAKHYHTLLEKLAQLQTDKSDGRLYALFNQLDFIRGSLQQITPGTVDVWDLIMALPRHRLSLSVICSNIKSMMARTCLELFAYGNYPLTNLKQALQRAALSSSCVGVGVYLSPLFPEAGRAFKPMVQKLLQQQQRRKQQMQQQQQLQQQQQQQQAQGQSQVSQAASSLTTQQMVPQQQQPQQPVVKQLTPQSAQQVVSQTAQQQSAAPQQVAAQQVAAQQVAAQQAASQQYKQQQVQQSKPQQQPGQQSWAPTAQPGAAAPAVATPPTAGSAGTIPASNMSQQPRMIAPQPAGIPQQQQQTHQQQRFGMVPVAQTGVAVQPQQPQQQQQSLPGSAQTGMTLGISAPAGLMQQQQQQAVQQQQPLVMLVQPGMQQVLVQPQAVGGFMPQQQMLPQHMIQQQQVMQQQQQQHQQMPMTVPVGQMAPAAASASGASIKMEKARVPFWSGPIILNVPELGISNQTLATVEISCSNPGTLQQMWSQRKHLVAHKLMQLQDVKQVLAAYKSQIIKVSYKVMQHGVIWQWLQQRVNASPQKQVFMLVQLAPTYQGVFFFGNQATKGQPQAAVNLNEGSFVLCGIDS